MMDFVLRNLAVLLVFLTIAACSWSCGGTHLQGMMPQLPWFLAFLFEGMLFFPQRRPYEDPVSARARTWGSLKKDPLTYFVLMFLVILALPFVNRGMCPSCDYPEILKLAASTGLSAEEVAKPPVPFAPYCVNMKEHFNVYMWFLPALVALLAARHSLLRSGKRMLLEMMVWNGALVAVHSFIFKPVYGYLNMGGAFFAMVFALSIGLWQYRIADVDSLPHENKSKSLKDQALHRWLRAHYPLIPLVLIFFGAINTLSRAAMLTVFITAAGGFLYYIMSLLFSRKDRARRIRHAAFAIGGGLFFLLLVSVFAPPELGKEMNTIDSFGLLDRVSGKAEYHNRVAVSIFKEHPLFGVGGWGYKHYELSYLSKEELKTMQIDGGANVHNDHLQFLCEHGLVGSLLLFAIFFALIAPVFRDWYLLYRAARFTKADKAPPRPRAIYCLPAGTFWILIGGTGLMIHACGDCPLRSAGVLSTFFVSLACAEGFLPRDIGEGSTR